MNNVIPVSINLLPTFMLGLVLGLVLGTTFFGILWFTVRKGLISLYPARWFLGGLVLRMSIALSGFYYAANRDWLTLLVCLLGFVIARELIRRSVVFRQDSSPSVLNTEQNNAP